MEPNKPPIIVPDIPYKSYRGNPFVKRAGIQIEWTGEMISEYLKCEADPVYFLETYMKIVTSDYGLIPLKLWDFQKEMLQNFQDYRHNIVLTARQVGKSTTTCGYILWFICFHPDKTVALIANKGDTAREILTKIQIAYQHIPKWLVPGALEWNKGTCILENNSRVLASATSSDNIVGYTVNLLFLDEAAKIENWDEFAASAFPTVSSGTTTKVIMVSTPKGLNHFYKLWQQSINGDNDYKRILVKWTSRPGYDAAWKKVAMADCGNDPDKFAQEYECEFLGSSGTLISGQKLKELVHKIPVYQDEGLLQYKRPVPGHRYTIIDDPAEGKGLDYSAFHVIDTTQLPYDQVATCRDNWSLPQDHAEMIHNMARHYNDASVLVETNLIGAQICHILWYDYEYTNVIWTENAGPLGKLMSMGFGAKKTELGIKTGPKVKSMGCSWLKILIENNQLIINDFETIHELSTFSKKNRSYEAEPGNHDDLVMGLVLFAWLTDQPDFKEATEINTLSRLRKRTEEEITATMMPMMAVDDHHKGREDEDGWHGFIAPTRVVFDDEGWY